MKPLRLLILLVVAAIALAGVRFWPHRTASTKAGADTPAQCLDEYYDSLQSGDIDKYLRCLGEPYRTDVGRSSFEAVRRDAKDVKGFVQRAGPAEDGSPLWVDVDEVRAADVRRLRYHLRHDDRGWVITAIDPPREVPAAVRYGTPVSDEP